MRYSVYHLGVCMIAKNKWTDKLYTVFSESVKTFELQRADGSEFEILKSEFYFNYRVIEEDDDDDDNDVQEVENNG